MELFFLSSRGRKRSHTSPGIEKTIISQFQPMLRRFHQIRVPLLPTRLSERLLPNLACFTSFTDESHQGTAVSFFSFQTWLTTCALVEKAPAAQQQASNIASPADHRVLQMLPSSLLNHLPVMTFCWVKKCTPSFPCIYNSPKKESLQPLNENHATDAGTPKRLRRRLGKRSGKRFL
jgi:hypothetical protein